MHISGRRRLGRGLRRGGTRPLGRRVVIRLGELAYYFR